MHNKVILLYINEIYKLHFMNNTIKELKAEIQQLLTTIDMVATHEGETSRIDIDLLLEKIRRAYDKALQLYVADNGISNPDNQGAVLQSNIEKPYEDAYSAAETSVATSVMTGIANTIDDETSILLADTESEPVYAPEPEPREEESEVEEQPSMEEIEGRQNDDLFEEEAPVPENVPEPIAEPVIEPEPIQEPQHEPEPEPEPEPVSIPEPKIEPATEPAAASDTQEMSPKTLWEALQRPQMASTIGDNIAPQKTLSDLLSNKGGETTIGEKKIMPESTVESVASTVKAPKTEEAPVATEKSSVSAHSDSETSGHNNIQASLFDYFKHTSEASASRTIADSLGENKKQNLEERLSTGKVTDLLTIININDKFRFMNELFHNNMKGYNDFIIRLNAIDNREEALEYVKTISEQYNWDNDSLAVKTFYGIFDKKF